MAVHRRRPTSLDYESANVFDLALDRVRPGVAAVAPAATVVIQHGEMLRQLLCGRTGQCTVAHRAPHHDDMPTIAQPVEGDLGAIPQSNLVHELASFLVRRVTIVWFQHTDIVLRHIQ